MQLKQVLIALFSFSSMTMWAHEKHPMSLSPLLDTVPIKERYGDFLSTKRNPFDLKDPAIVEKNVEYDPKTNQYIVTEKIGEDYFRMPTYMTAQEYYKWKGEQQERAMFDKLAGVGKSGKTKSALVNPFAKLDLTQMLTDRLFGGTEVSIIPQGNIDLTIGARYLNQKNPVVPVFQQRQVQPDFNMDIQVNVTGKIGEKLSLSTSYNNKAAFNFDNVLKLNYDTKGLTAGLPGVGGKVPSVPGMPGIGSFSEDEIIKDIGAGNVSLPLKSNLIQGASSLFGLKMEMQFGKLRFTTVAAQQQSRRQQVQVKQGGQKYIFQLGGDQYDENRHFFFSHAFRNNYEPALTNLPAINSLYTVTYLEVWVTNDRQETNNVRDIVALTDLAEPEQIINTKNIKPKSIQQKDIYGKPLPTNDANNLYDKVVSDESLRNIDRAVRELTSQGGGFQMQQTKDFEKVRARKLSSSDYTFDAKLGYISLNFQLRPNQVLGVAYTYKYNGKEYKVGELSSNAPQIGTTRVTDPVSGAEKEDTTQKVLFVKMLKSSTPRLDIPLWDLMMKNVYSLGASQINKEDFKLEIYYNKPGDGERRFLPDTKVANVPLLRVFNLDRLNVQGDPQPDGVFDYVEGITINSRQGKIIFPVLEPFGKALEKSIGNPIDARRYIFQQLYDTTITAAREFPEFNVFTIKGQYKGTSQSEIQLNTFNLPRGSVKVTAGSQPLIEGSDYEVNYSSGTVKILNEAYVNSSVPVNVSFEDNQLFGFQQKSMFGTRWDYTINKDFIIGGTMLKLFERPYTNKVNVGEDPINNNIFGLDVNYTKEAPWLTKMVDKLPFISTKVPSTINLVAEGAFLKPGHSRAINQKNLPTDKRTESGGVVYIEDFEGSTNGTDLRQPNLWYMASVPQNDRENNNPRFPESAEINSFENNKNRAKLSWYVVSDNGGNLTTRGTVRTKEDNESPNFGAILESEIWPNRQFSNPTQGSINVRMFDLSYNPKKRGPYNYDEVRAPGSQKPRYSEGLDPQQGTLLKPETRWGGIMRALPYNDFEASNVEFIDMWMLSPFLDSRTTNLSGKLHIDLGNISEDILRDSRQFFENGLPTKTLRVSVDQTKVARIPRIVPVTNAFDLTAGARDLQDVGLDGLTDDEEQNQFSAYVNNIKNSGLSSAVKADIEKDPSNDNFQYFLDDKVFSSADGVLNRYENFNNQQGNSGESTGADVNSSTNIPDSEDLDNNKSLDNEGESYFHYEVPLVGKGDGEMLTHPFIVDQIPVLGKKADWGLSEDPLLYRIRIPISQFTSKVGGIQDFRSIRFMRVYLTDFAEPVVLRFAKFELSRSQWRRYKRSPCVVEPGTGTFDMTSVNFEENGSRPNFNYVLPPGIQREQIPGAATAILQNEQAMALSVCNLLPECERSIYKLTTLDTRLFKRLKMFVHMEENPGCTPTTPDKGDLTAFMRIGNDFEKNYYEYEIPLRKSNKDDLPLSNLDAAYAREIWPEENEFNFPLELLQIAKKARNATVNWGYDTPYRIANPERTTDTVTVKGNPNLGWVKGIMLGVRNTSTKQTVKSHSVEVWFNELRVNGFNEQGGSAALARADFKLADLGRLTFSGNYTGIGWGGLEQRLQQRAREQVVNYDMASTLELGKFFPEKSGVKVPFTFQYTHNDKTPEYDPYDLDIKLKDKLNTAPAEMRDSLREQAITASRVRNISFDNVRKEATGGGKKKLMPWSISNFSVSYQNTLDRYSDPILQAETKELNRGQLDYNYTIPGSMSITPFKKLIKNDKNLKFLSDFNFNPLPNSVSFNTDLRRQYNTSRYRFTPQNDSLSVFYNKRFGWDRKYNLNWDLSKGIKFNFAADVMSVVDEPYGKLDTREEKDSLLRNLSQLGRVKVYNQTANLNYVLPTKQIPLMDWITVRAQLNTGYNWNAAALNTTFLGNTIKNTQQRQVTGDFSFEQLYNNSKYLKKINTPKGAPVKKKREPRKLKDASAGKLKEERVAKNDIKSIRDNAVSDELSPAEMDRDSRPSKEGDNREETVKKDEKDPARERLDALNNPATNGEASDAAGKETASKAKTAEEKAAENKLIKEKKLAEKKAKKEKDKEDREPSNMERAFLRPLMMVRKGRFSYTENISNVVPGFKPQAGLFGQENFTAPGWDFLVGRTPDDTWLDNAAAKGWIVDTLLLNESVQRNRQQQLQAQLTVEPFQDFRIEFEARRDYTNNHTQDFKVFEENGGFGHRALRDVGSYTVSYLNFKGLADNDTAYFQQFLDNRRVISQRLAGPNAPAHERDNGYYAGYGKTNQEVLIPAFMSAFNGKDPNTIDLNLFNTIPLPNWRLNYAGLSKIPMFKDKIQSFTLTHSYKSTLTVSQFNTNSPDFEPDNALRKDVVNRNYYAQLNIPTIQLTKEFSPLIGIDMKLKNDLSIRADFKKAYNLQMSFFDNQLMEQKRKEYTIGIGYKMKNVHLKFLDFLNFSDPTKTKDGEKKKGIIKFKDDEKEEEKPEIDPKTGKPKKKKKKAKKGNDLTMKCDFALQDNVTYNNQIDGTTGQPTRGDFTLRLEPTMEYQVNKQLALNFYFGYNTTKPKTSLSFPTTNIRGGIKLRFSLQ